MSDSLPISSSRPEGIRPIDAGSTAREADKAPGGPAFKALLDQLEQRTQQLSKKSAGELSRDGLADAVGDARASLEQMLSLKDRLIEDWRAAEQQSRAKP